MCIRDSNTTITITFNDNIKPGPSYANIALTSGAFTKTINGNTLTITPTSNLPYNSYILLTIPADAVLTTAGSPMIGTGAMAFTTVTPLTATAVTPASGATNVPVNTIITITFNDNIKPGPSYANIALTSGAFTKTINGNTLTITPTSNLPYNSYILLTIPADAVLTTAGSPMIGTGAMAFTTVTPLTATAVTPASGATNVPVNTIITITFNDNIKPGPSYANIALTSGAFTKTINGNTLTITPTSNLPYNS